MRLINEIIIHCSATPPAMDIGATEIRDWHVNERHWQDIGYHYVIRRNGVVDDGREVSKIGAHARGHNEESIGVCLIGGVDENNKPDANFTLSQFNALSTLVAKLRLAHATIHKITGHRDYSSMKACPCFDVNALFP